MLAFTPGSAAWYKNEKQTDSYKIQKVKLCINVTMWNTDQNKTVILCIFLLALFWLSFVFIDCQTHNDNLVCCTPQASFQLFQYSVPAPICLQKKVWHSATEAQNHSEPHGSIFDLQLRTTAVILFILQFNKACTSNLHIRKNMNWYHSACISNNTKDNVSVLKQPKEKHFLREISLEYVFDWRGWKGFTLFTLL